MCLVRWYVRYFCDYCLLIVSLYALLMSVTSFIMSVDCVVMSVEFVVMSVVRVVMSRVINVVIWHLDQPYVESLTASQVFCGLLL